jgi:hypothetical protein
MEIRWLFNPPPGPRVVDPPKPSPSPPSKYLEPVVRPRPAHSLSDGELALWSAAYVAELGRYPLRPDRACTYAQQVIEGLRAHVASTVPGGRGMAGEVVGG